MRRLELGALWLFDYAVSYGVCGFNPLSNPTRPLPKNPGRSAIVARNLNVCSVFRKIHLEVRVETHERVLRTGGVLHDWAFCDNEFSSFLSR